MEQELRYFPRFIGCQYAIRIMEEEKLDLTVISCMSVDDMVQILPMLGDIIVLKSLLGIINTRHCHDTATEESHNTCTSESSLKKHKVEFGWIATRGGSRKIELPRNSRKEEVLDEARQEIQDEITKELYESSKVSLLRLDMVTWKNDSLITESLTVQDQNMILSQPLNRTTISLPESLHDGLESDHKPPSTCPLHISVPVHLLSREEFSFESVLKVTPSHSHPVAASIFESVETLSTHSHALQLASFANMYGDFTQNHSSDNQILFQPGDNHLNTTSELDDTIGHVLDDMMNYFLDTNFDPILNQFHDIIQLSQDFLQRCIDGKDVQDEKLLNTFLSSLTTMDREIFDIALNDCDSVDEEDLCNVFSSYEARIMPTKYISKLVIDISHHQIEQNTSFITECWSPLIQCFLRSLLPITGHEEVYIYFQVTNNVLNLLQLPDDLSKSEKLTLYALRQYIKSCNKDKLLAFLLFCTGSDLTVGRQIKVVLTTSMSAFNLRPIAHTCGCEIELCTSYDNFLLPLEHFDTTLVSKLIRMDMF
ncbi:hypothetical protein ACJMK2_005852 [Sinanodonta woodiana]|uniref:Uncharacterized protein n=1 Tax=Sinanodonta woodiana TaxID=1069815 RepID=A0ABD3VSQ1_SINWO